MRKLIATILAISLVFPLLLSAQTAVSVTSWALDRQFYIDALDQPEIYSTLTSSPMIEKFLHERLGLPPEADTSELESVLKSILTTDYMRGEVSDFFNALFDQLQGKTDTFAPTIDLVPLKTALEGSHQDAFLNALVTTLPTCAPGQNPGFGGEGQTACKPVGVPDELLIEQVLKPALPNILSKIPDEFPLEDKLPGLQEPDHWRSFLPGMAVPASIILGILVLVFIATFAWYVTALISDASWRVRLQWLGWMLLIPAALIFLLSFTAQSGIPAYWIHFGLDNASTSFGPDINKSLRIISVSALPRVANAFQMVGGISGALAISLIFWGIATPRKKHEEVE